MVEKNLPGAALLCLLASIPMARADAGPRLIVEDGGSVQAIVYAAGEGQTDLHLLARHHDGSLAGPYTLAAESYDEGRDPFSRNLKRPIRVVGDRERIGVLWRARDGTFPTGGRWAFREFDLEGNPIGPKRDLRAEFGVVAYSQPALERDPARGRYVLVWGGVGPEGPGTYWAAIDERP